MAVCSFLLLSLKKVIPPVICDTRDSGSTFSANFLTPELQLFDQEGMERIAVACAVQCTYTLFVIRSETKIAKRQETL